MESEPQAPLPPPSQTPFHFFQQKTTQSKQIKRVHGFDNELLYFQKLIQTHDKFKSIGISGTRGVGKSTLCKLLVSQSKQFVPRIWVSMPDKSDHGYNKIEIVKTMLTCLGVRDEISEFDHSFPDQGKLLSGLIYLLHLQLVGKKYLIVLDNCKEIGEWYKDLKDDGLGRNKRWGDRLAYGLPKGGGGVVVVTSREEGVVENMVGRENLRQLLSITDEDSFSEIYKQEFKRDNDVVLKKDDLIKKCGGLPLAAKMLGRIKKENNKKKREEEEKNKKKREEEGKKGLKKEDQREAVGS